MSARVRPPVVPRGSPLRPPRPRAASTAFGAGGSDPPMPSDGPRRCNRGACGVIGADSTAFAAPGAPPGYTSGVTISRTA